MSKVSNVSMLVAIVASIIASITVATTDGSALYLTQLINEGRLDEARSLSKVPPTADMILESYAGYLTVKPPDKGHMFFWFFPALKNSETAPVILWMNGGPGNTALAGLFAEMGPYFIDDDGHVQIRDINWANKFNVIFIDTPLGTGFSHVKSQADMSATIKEIGKDLLSAITQFFTIYSSYQGQDFYVAGESFASRYAIALATELETHKNSPSSSFVSLKGVILVSGFYDTINEITIADFAYQTGLISEKFKDKMKSDEFIAHVGLTLHLQFLLINRIHINELNENGTDARDDSPPSPMSAWSQETGIRDSDNILYDYVPSTFYTFQKFLDGADVRRALHVGNVTFHNYPAAILMMMEVNGEATRSMRPELQNLLNAGYKVLAMAGNMDRLVPPESALAAARALDWKCKSTYQNAKRIIWKVQSTDKNSAGYVQCGCNYCNAMIRNAGHRIPADEPERALDLLDRFINGRPFDD